MHRMAPVRQRHGHSGSQRGLAHATLAHEHDQAMAILCDLVYQPGEAGRLQRGRRAVAGSSG